MSKILRNVTGSTVFINDTGVSIPAGMDYAIPQQDYLLWGASSDVVTAIGDIDIVVNDGTFDLTISNGIDLIKGFYPKQIEVLPSGVLDSRFNQISSVPNAIRTEVISYTAVSGDDLLQVSFSGTNIAQYELELNGDIIDQCYTFYGNLNGTMQFNQGYQLLVSDELKLYVLHNKPMLGDFSSKILIRGA